MTLKHSVVIAVALACWTGQANAAGRSAVLNVGGRKGSKTAGVGIGSEKIVGGYGTSITKWPFMAHIGIQTEDGYAPQCGGTILDKRHILSAAHCFTNRSLSYRARVGSTTWARGGQLVDVTAIYAHPEYYKAAAYDYDVAVVRVSRDLVFGRTVNAVDLVAARQPIVANTEVTLIGWGYTDALHSNPLPSSLREVVIEAIDSSECVDDYSGYDLTVTDRMFCGMAQEKDSCQGDSGGPVYNAKTRKQVGVISWGMGCAQMGSPGVFANLADPSIRSFITQSQKK